MNRSFITQYILLMAVLSLLLSCAKTPGPKHPSLLLQAERHNIKGVAAASRQEFAAAEAEFAEAYRLFGSVENYRGMITSLVNSSRLYRHRGEKSKSEKVMKLAVELVGHARDLESEVCFEMVKLAMLGADPISAMIWAERGVDSASQANRGKMLNLLVTVYLQKNDFVNARNTAVSALKASREVNDKREEANTLRNLGDLAFRENSFKESRKFYESALPLDKELAVPLRISDDLRGIARSFEASGDLNSAIGYFQRSARLNMAECNDKRAEEDLEKLKAIFDKTGNIENISSNADLLENMRNSCQTSNRR